MQGLNQINSISIRGNMSKKEDFKVIQKNCGKGMHSRIWVVKRKSDKKAFIWKRPISNSNKHQEAFKKEFKKSKFWRAHGLSKVRVRWHPDKKSLLKTIVKGPTLREVLKRDHHFFSNTGNKKYKALKKFFRLLVKSGRYIGDVSPKNLAWDGKRWQIIDSSSVRGKESRSSLKRRYKEKFINKWSMNLNWGSKDIHSVESFIDSI